MELLDAPQKARPGGIGEVLTTNTTEIYDPATGKWSFAGRMEEIRELHTATLLNDGRVLVVGGRTNGHGVTGAVEIYNPTSGTFSTTNELTTGRLYHAATLLSNGKILIAAGTLGPLGPIGSAELFSPAP